MSWVKNIPILDVVSACGYTTFKKGGSEYGIVQDGKKTDGRGVCTEKGIVKDFTGKGRPEGDGFSFVRSYLKASDDGDVFKWFSDNFPTYAPVERKPILLIFSGMRDLGDRQIEYLKSRGVEYEKVKSLVKEYNGSIACMIYKGGVPQGINARTLEEVDKKKRFVAYPGYPTEGIYMGKIDKSKDYLFVVEGLIDFLTIYQYDQNVVGLKSAQSGHDEVARLSHDYRLYVVFDNDEAGKETKNKLLCKYQYFNRDQLGDLEAKDVNDLHKHTGDAICDVIKEHLISDTPILRTIDKFLERQKILKEKGKLGFDGPYPFYEYTSGIVKKKVYSIAAFSNTGKSKLAYAHTARFLKQGKSCMYISIEESEEDIFQNIAIAYEQKELKDIHSINPKNYENLICLETVRSIKEIDEVVKSFNPEIVFIDYAQGLQAKGGSAYEKNANIAYGLQQIAIQNNTTLFVLHQVSNSQHKENDQRSISNLDTVMIKGAGEYFAASDFIIALAREDEKLYAKVVKNKLGPRGMFYEVKADLARNIFEFEKSKLEENFGFGK